MCHKEGAHLGYSVRQQKHMPNMWKGPANVQYCNVSTSFTHQDKTLHHMSTDLFLQTKLAHPIQMSQARHLKLTAQNQVYHIAISNLPWLVHDITTPSQQAEGMCPLSLVGSACCRSLVCALAPPVSCSPQSSPQETYASHQSWLVSVELIQNLFKKSAKHRGFPNSFSSTSI